MCVSITNEKAAANWIAECVRTYPNVLYVQPQLEWAQSRGWLLNYDMATCQPKITGKPGMRVVREAIEETKKLPAPVKGRERVASA